MPTSTWTVDQARDTVAGWTALYRENGGRLGPDSLIETFAAQAALRLRDDRHAEVMYQPGNRTNYSLALALLDDGPAGAWGGPLLIAMPEWMDGGRASAFGVGYELDPDCVADHLRLCPADAVAVASFLTLLSALLVA